jgi:hypothetical protein
MYFDFEDYRPDISPVGSAISLREGVLLAFIAHLLGIIFLLLSPKIFPEDLKAKAAAVLAVQEQQARDQTRFVFVQPRVERPVPAPPPIAEPSDRDRLARTPSGRRSRPIRCRFRAAIRRSASTNRTGRARSREGRARSPIRRRAAARMSPPRMRIPRRMR